MKTAAVTINMLDVNSLPQQVGDFDLEKTITHNKPVVDYSYGLYSDAMGNKAYAKQWSGKIKNMARYWFDNEVNVYQAINKVSESDEIKKLFPHIHIPKLLYTQQSPNQAVMLMEYVDGVSVKSKTTEEKVVLISDILNYFGHISDKLASQKLLVRKQLHLILFFYYAWVSALVKHPKLFKELVKAFLIFTSNLTDLWGPGSEVKLVHRDLSDTNILFKDSKYYVIDYQIAVLSFSLMDVVIALFNRFDDSKFWNSFQNTPVVKEKIQQNYSLYKSLSIYTAVFELGLIPIHTHNWSYPYLKKVVSL